MPTFAYFTFFKLHKFGVLSVQNLNDFLNASQFGRLCYRAW
jgi:hypothetical protein